MTCSSLESVALYFFSAAAQVWAALAVLALIVLRDELRAAKTGYVDTRVRLHGVYTSVYQNVAEKLVSTYNNNPAAKTDLDRAGIVPDDVIEAIFDDETFERVVYLLADTKFLSSSWGRGISGQTSRGVSVQNRVVVRLVDKVARLLREASYPPAKHASKRILETGFIAIGINLVGVGVALLPCLGIVTFLILGGVFNAVAGWMTWRHLNDTSRPAS